MSAFVFALLVALSFVARCSAQSGGDIESQIESYEVFAAYEIADMAFVVQYSEAFRTSAEERDLAKLIAPSAAVKAGLPAKSMTKLIDKLLGMHHEPRLVAATAHNCFGRGYFWKMQWYLFPSPGGFSGTPYEYHAVVRADGTQVKPEVYLCDRCQWIGLVAGKPAFSVMAVDDLLPACEIPVDVDNIRQAAVEKFDAARSEFEWEAGFRVLPPKRRVISDEFATNGGSGKQLEVWGVRFVHETIENPEDTDYVASIVVWVTSDLMVSEITQDKWKAESRRRVDTE